MFEIEVCASYVHAYTRCVSIIEIRTNRSRTEGHRGHAHAQMLLYAVPARLDTTRCAWAARSPRRDVANGRRCYVTVRRRSDVERTSRYENTSAAAGHRRWVCSGVLVIRSGRRRAGFRNVGKRNDEAKGTARDDGQGSDEDNEIASCVRGRWNVRCSAMSRFRPRSPRSLPERRTGAVYLSKYTYAAGQGTRIRFGRRAPSRRSNRNTRCRVYHVAATAVAAN